MSATCTLSQHFHGSPLLTVANPLRPGNFPPHPSGAVCMQRVYIVDKRPSPINALLTDMRELIHADQCHNLVACSQEYSNSDN